MVRLPNLMLSKCDYRIIDIFHTIPQVDDDLPIDGIILAFVSCVSTGAGCYELR